MWRKQTRLHQCLLVLLLATPPLLLVTGTLRHLLVVVPAGTSSGRLVQTGNTSLAAGNTLLTQGRRTNFCYSADGKTLKYPEMTVNHSSHLWEEDSPDVRLPHSFINYAKRLVETGRVPMLTVVNKMFLPLTHSWLCNLRGLFPDVLPQVMIICTDPTAYRSLGHAHGDVYMHLWRLPEAFEGKLEWDAPLYRRYLAWRVRVNILMLRANLSFLQVEPDAVWFRDPRPLLDGIIRDSGGDVIGARLGGPGPYREGHISVNFLYLRATGPALNAWLNIHRTLEHSLERTYEQEVLDCLCQARYGNVTCVTARWQDISDGNWYNLDYREREKFCPYVVNNNFIVGIDTKIKRVKWRNQWFVVEETPAVSLVNGSAAGVPLLEYTCSEVAISRFKAKVESLLHNTKPWQVPKDWRTGRVATPNMAAANYDKIF